MATLTAYSNNIANRIATPIVKNSPAVDGGDLKIKSVTVAVAAADADGSIYGLCAIPSNAVVHKIELYNSAITAGIDYDFGLYTMNVADNTIVTAANVDAWASALDLSSARATPVDIVHESADSPIDYNQKKVFELAGATTDPQTPYMICATGNTVGSAAGKITVKVIYSV
jgi:hypothetical protein